MSDNAGILHMYLVSKNTRQLIMKTPLKTRQRLELKIRFMCEEYGCIGYVHYPDDYPEFGGERHFKFIAHNRVYEYVIIEYP